MTMPSPDLFAQLPTQIAGEIKAILPSLRQCSGRVGRMSVDELKREGIKAPAVMVSFLGLKQSDHAAGGYVGLRARMAAYIVTTHQMGQSRDEAAAVIGQALCGFIPRNTWKDPALGEASDVELLPLVSTGSTREAISLWAVTWFQPLTLFEAIHEPVPEGFLVQGPKETPNAPSDDPLEGAA